MVFKGHFNPQQTLSTSVGRGWIDGSCVRHGQKRAIPCEQSHWKGYSVFLLCMRGIGSLSLFSTRWTALCCGWSNFVSLESRGKRWSKALRAGPFFPWPALLEGWKRLLSNTSSKKTHQSRQGAWPGLRKQRVDVTRREWTWTHVACSMCVREGHTPVQTQLRRVGVYWILMGWEKTLSLSLLLCLIPSQACGLLSCEHTASIKDLFISLFGLSFASWCEKVSFTEVLQSNSHSSQFISYCQLDLTGNLWESRCLSLMLPLCGLWGYAGGTMCHVPACLQGFCQTMLPLSIQHPDTHAHTCSYI